MTRTVVVLDLPDTTSPVVTLSGSTNITLEVGTPYTDDGESWIDDVDGS